jgi:TPR repeat protein
MRVAGREAFLAVVFLTLAVTPAAYAQDIPGLKIKAEQGDVQAQSALGKAYHSGDGVAKDDAEAVRWWEKAAEKGDLAAQVNLGIAYNFGTGVPKNYAATARWWQKAAEQGNGGAQADLALLYHLGLGVPKDDAEAVRWWKKAGALGGEPCDIAWCQRCSRETLRLDTSAGSY